MLRAARAVLMLVAGAEKHEALRRVLGEDVDVADAPATLLHELEGDVAWFVDRGALFGTPSR
jgi:6-phosphogluconolactonase/glucosamine-6-phosphate isomerase/deaminase